MTPFECYVYYLAIKRHFSSNYDIIKYNGKVRVNKTSFEKRNDKYFFAKLAKRKDCKEFILANVIHNHNLWIGDLSKPEADDIYNDWLMIQQSLTYILKSNLKKMDDNFDKNFEVINGQYPKLLELYIEDEIELETLTILVSLTGCINIWNKKIADTILYPNLARVIVKYEPLLSYNRDDMRRLILKHFDT